MKREVAFFLVIFFISIALADLDIHNVSIATSYPKNQFLTGEINLSFENLNVNTVLKTNKGHSINLIDLLYLHDCVPHDCSNRYSSKRTNKSLNFSLASGKSALAGFYLEGSTIRIDKISFDIKSDFNPGTSIPLRIDLFDNNDDEWIFAEFTSDEFRKAYYGFYNPSYSEPGPYIRRNTYCSEIQIHQTNRFMAGFETLQDGETAGELEVLLYNDQGGYIDKKTFDPSTKLTGVSFENPELFSAGYYYLCVRSKEENSDYRIKKESQIMGCENFNQSDCETHEYAKLSNCIWKNNQCIRDVQRFNSFSFENKADDSLNMTIATKEKSVNYGIYVNEAKYAGSSQLKEIDFSEYITRINGFIEEVYGRDCSQGCYIPIRIKSGVDQNLVIENVSVEYSVDGELSSDKIHELNNIPGLMTFSGIINLRDAGFQITQSGEYKFYIDEQEVHKQQIIVTGAPEITGIYPTVVPAGLDVLFTAYTHFDGDNSSLSYEWEFGDGSSRTSTTNKITHRYNNISEYNLKLTIKTGNLTNFKEVKIQTITPQKYVPIILKNLQEYLKSAIEDINRFPEWIQKPIKDLLKTEDIEYELKDLENKINRSYDTSDYLGFASKIYPIDVPVQVFVSESSEYDFAPSGEMNIMAVKEHTRSTLEGTTEEYIDSISQWQNANVDYNVITETISYLSSKGNYQDLMVTYTMTVKNNHGGDIYLVLDTTREKLFFKNIEKEPKEAEGATIFEIREGDSLTIEFYIHGSQTIDFFSSPKLSDIILGLQISKECNFNLICDEGESHKTCSSDCKPITLMIIYIILSALGVLVLYTLLQVWYLKYYEDTLFTDKKRLYNLLMYVNAAQNKGMSREQIKKALSEKGWTNERIDFIIKKANGERIGLYEIIPISKFTSNKIKNDAKSLQGKPLSPPPSFRPHPLANNQRIPSQNQRFSKPLSRNQQIRPSPQKRPSPNLINKPSSPQSLNKNLNTNLSSKQQNTKPKNNSNSNTTPQNNPNPNTAPQNNLNNKYPSNQTPDNQNKRKINKGDNQDFNRK